MNFDRLAPFYRAMELFTAGGKLQRCRMAFLEDIPVPRRILLAGEGHGRFLPECVRKFPEAAITVVDASKRMLDLSGRARATHRVDYIHTDILEWEIPDGSYDLIVTHFFLDCFTAEELPRVIGKLVSAATPEADWLVADFEIAPSGIAKWRSRVILWMLYTFFRVVGGLKADTLIAPDALLESMGFQKKGRRSYEWGLLKSEWWCRK